MSLYGTGPLNDTWIKFLPHFQIQPLVSTPAQLSHKNKLPAGLMPPGAAAAAARQQNNKF